MNPGKLVIVFVGLSFLALAATPVMAGGAEVQGQKQAGKTSNSAGSNEKDVAMAHLEQPCGGFETLDKIIKDVTDKLQKKIEYDFSRFLEKRLLRP